MLASLGRLAKANENYRNFFGLFGQRLLKRPMLTVCDRQSGLTFRCRRAAQVMLGEVLHLKCYDLPLVPIRAGDVVVDIGANHGFYACHAAKLGASVFAYEPDPDLVALLRENVERNGLTKQVVCHQTAIGGVAGEVELFRTEQLGGGMNTILPQLADQQKSATIRVPCQRLEDALTADGVSRVRVCKIDCEGAELDILKSLSTALRSRIDGFALEFHAGAYDLTGLIDLIFSWGDFHIAVMPEFNEGNQIMSMVRDELVREGFERFQQKFAKR